jgi:2-polyprenyl-6-methoxyphenol hydroxylase-like FAD-dependent oxidoreductase
MALKAVLDKFRINSVIIERQKELQQHPKAHYLSFRSCEILKDLGLGKNLEDQLKRLDQWNHYSYTTHVLARPISLVRHLTLSDIAAFQQQFTYAFPSHYSQHRLNRDLYQALDSKEVHFGTGYEGHKVESERVTVQTNSGKTVDCRLVVAADGVKSKVRQNVGIEMRGKKSK